MKEVIREVSPTKSVNEVAKAKFKVKPRVLVSKEESGSKLGKDASTPKLEAIKEEDHLSPKNEVLRGQTISESLIQQNY